VSAWRRCTVGDVLVGIVAGKSPQAAGRPASDGERGVLKVSAVSWGSFLPQENKALPASYVVPASLTVRAGDLLVSRANTVELVGAVVMAVNDHPNLMLSDKTLRLEVREDLVDRRFLLHALRTREVRTVFEEDATGTSDSMRNLSQEKIRSAPLLLPPIDVQRRIVAKLDALLAHSRAAREHLDAVPALVEQYRQSVLAAAFRGDLTKEWRAKNPDVEPASKLLERIRTERRRQWEAGELAKMKAKGKEPKDDKWKAKYEEPEPADVSGLPELPPTWAWAAVEELCPFDAPAVYGIIQPGPHVERGVPYIRPLDIDADGHVRAEELNRTSRQIADDYERAMLAPGDVVLSIVGTIGKVLVVPPELDGANITQSSIRIRPPKQMPTAYMQRLLQSPVMRRQFDRYRFGNAVQRLNVEHVRRLAVPVAPEREAHALVQLLGPRLEQVGAAAVAVGAIDVQQLQSALLAKAFRGELDLDAVGEVGLDERDLLKRGRLLGQAHVHLRGQSDLGRAALGGVLKPGGLP